MKNEFSVYYIRVFFFIFHLSGLRSIYRFLRNRYNLVANSRRVHVAVQQQCTYEHTNHASYAWTN